MLPVTPMRIHSDLDASVVVGSDGGLVGLNSRGQVTDTLRPMSNPISSSLLLDDYLIATWNFYDIEASSYMGLIPKEFFLNFEEALELSHPGDEDVGPAGATWWRKLEGTVESIGGEGDRFIFALTGLGIYSMNLKIEDDLTSTDEAWRSHYPTWTLSSEPAIRDSIASILITESGILVISEGGEWILLSDEDGAELDRGILNLRNPVNHAVHSGDLGIIVMTRGKELILMDSDRKITDHIRKIPGPVLDAYAGQRGWKWTGWRHDGSFVGGQLLIRIRSEIGIGMLGSDMCVCNDGAIEDWGSYSSESDVV